MRIGTADKESLHQKWTREANDIVSIMKLSDPNLTDDELEELKCRCHAIRISLDPSNENTTQCR